MLYIAVLVYVTVVYIQELYNNNVNFVNVNFYIVYVNAYIHTYTTIGMYVSISCTGIYREYIDA